MIMSISIWIDKEVQRQHHYQLEADMIQRNKNALMVFKFEKAEKKERKKKRDLALKTRFRFFLTTSNFSA
jgi:hypothetical protein